LVLVLAATVAAAGERPGPTTSADRHEDGPELIFALQQDDGSEDESADEGQGGEDGEEGADTEGTEGEEGEEGEQTEGEGEQQGSTLQRGNRMEFDARLVRGERAGSGAVFLFQRVPRPLPSMVDKRSSFLGDSVEDTLGQRWKKKFDSSKQESSSE
jgi:hypothetical protein